jgi:hypothetical protein
VKAFEQSLLFPVDKKSNFGTKEDAQVGKICVCVFNRSFFKDCKSLQMK